MVTKVSPFEDDFNDGDDTGWTMTGTWSASTGDMRNTASTGSVTFQRATTDGDLDLRFAYTSLNDTNNRQFYVYPRFDSSGNRVAIIFQPGQARLLEYDASVPAWTTLDTDTGADSLQDVTYEVRVECDGTDITVWRDGAIILSTTVATDLGNANVRFQNETHPAYPSCDGHWIRGIRSPYTLFFDRRGNLA